MSFGVDTLGGLSEKLKQLVNDTQSLYESFIDATQLYKQGRMSEKEYFSKIGEFLVASSAMNFLSVRVILELKGALDKGTSLKSPTGGSAGPTTPQAGFGVGGFVDAGGSAGYNQSRAGETILPMPPTEPTFRPVEITIPRQQQTLSGATKNCIACGTTIPQKAKFCSKCGHSQ